MVRLLSSKFHSYRIFSGLGLLSVVGLLLLSSSCAKDAAPASAAAKPDCITPSAYTPSLTGAGAGNHYAGASSSQTTVTGTGKIIGLAQGWSSADELTFSIDMSTDLGMSGSLTATFETVQFPADISGGAFFVPTYLHDGTNDHINLAAACKTGGIFTCPSGSCSVNPSCVTNAGSGFESISKYLQHVIPPFGTSSTLRVPLCNQGAGSGCPYNTIPLFQANVPSTSQKLRTGTWTMKGILLASSYATLSGYTAGTKGTIAKKIDATALAAQTHAIDVNVILVGNNNMNASRSTKGAMNLNILLNEVQGVYSQANTNVKLGTVTAYDFICSDGTQESYANIDINNVEKLLELTWPTTLPKRAINLFLVSTIGNGGSGSSTILGVAGQIGGPVVNGTGSSGVVIATANQLANYNPSCGSVTCGNTLYSNGFKELIGTTAHEMGHFLGLNHPSESSGSTHDVLDDTPQCSASAGLCGSNIVCWQSCNNTAPCSGTCAGYNGSSVFCPTQTNCQWNHTMWYREKNYKTGGTSSEQDGNLFTVESASQILLDWFTY